MRTSVLHKNATPFQNEFFIIQYEVSDDKTTVEFYEGQSALFATVYASRNAPMDATSFEIFGQVGGNDNLIIAIGAK